MSTRRKLSFADVARKVAFQPAGQKGWPDPPLVNDGLDTTRYCHPDPSLILPRLYLGDIRHAKDLDMLRKLKVSHILSIIERGFNIVPDMSDEEETRYLNTIKRLHLPLQDNFNADIFKHLDDTTNFINNALQDPDSVVLVHCFKGASRSATAVAAYLIATTTNFSCGADVVRFLRTKRSEVNPNFGFVMQLDRYTTLWNERRAAAQSLVVTEMLKASQICNSDSSTIQQTSSIESESETDIKNQ